MSGSRIGQKPAKTRINAFLGVPIVRSERVFGVLVVQNRVAARLWRRRSRGAADHRHGAGRDGGVRRVRRSLAGSPTSKRAPSRPEALQGRAFSDGIAIGTVVLHEPHAPLGRVIADDPVREEERLDDGARSRCATRSIEMLDGDPGRISGVSREVLETFLMLAADPSWEAKLKHGVRAGLSADAAVERVRGEHRAKLQRRARSLSARAAARSRRSGQSPAARAWPASTAKRADACPTTPSWSRANWARLNCSITAPSG